LFYLQILLVIISAAGVGFERTHLSGSEIGKSQQKAEADAGQRHYQAGLAALEKNDLAVAEEEMQAAARLAPKNALISTSWP
jgi:hypothetical protein